MSLHKAFNTLTLEFIEKLIITLPKEKNFKLLKTGVSLMARINYRKPVNLFKVYVDKYRIYIINRDNDYFLKENFEYIIEENKNMIKLEENAFDLIDRLKNYWDDFSENNRNVVWEYLNQMLKITDAIT